jgi:negative regulator of flagellin synthesis FlgM
MRINQINTNNLNEKIESNIKVNNISKKTVDSNAETTSIVAFPKDSINFSSVTKTAQALTEKAIKSPDIRQERVEALKSQIASGTFNPSADEILDAILKDEKQ